MVYVYAFRVQWRMLNRMEDCWCLSIELWCFDLGIMMKVNRSVGDGTESASLALAHHGFTVHEAILVSLCALCVAGWCKNER